MQEGDSGEDTDDENDDDAGGDGMRSFLAHKENRALMQSKAHMFFDNAVEIFRAVLTALQQQQEEQGAPEQEGYIAQGETVMALLAPMAWLCVG